MPKRETEFLTAIDNTQSIVLFKKNSKETTNTSKEVLGGGGGEILKIWGM